MHHEGGAVLIENVPFDIEIWQENLDLADTVLLHRDVGHVAGMRPALGEYAVFSVAGDMPAGRTEVIGLAITGLVQVDGVDALWQSDQNHDRKGAARRRVAEPDRPEIAAVALAA